MNIDEIAAYLTRKWSRFPNPCEKHWCATPESIRRVEDELKITLPSNLIALSQLSPNYTVWFASIGENYESAEHIIAINKRLTSATPETHALPANLVVINQGYDEDYDCLIVGDVAARVMYINLESGDSVADAPIESSPNFDDYLNRL